MHKSRHILRKIHLRQRVPEGRQTKQVSKYSLLSCLTCSQIWPIHQLRGETCVLLSFPSVIGPFFPHRDKIRAKVSTEYREREY
jgi:hypothetical protein